MSVGLIIFEICGLTIGFGCLLFCLLYNIYLTRKSDKDCEERKHKSSIENNDKMK